MGAVTLDELLNDTEPGLADPHTTDRWRIRKFPSFGSTRISEVACEEVDLPFPIFQEKSKEVANTEIYFPGGTSISGFSCTFGLDQTAAIMKYVDAWSNTIQNPNTGGYRLPSAYKKNILVDLYNAKGEVIISAEIRNCWCMGMQNIQLNGQAARTMISVQFQCDTQRLIY